MVRVMVSGEEGLDWLELVRVMARDVTRHRHAGRTKSRQEPSETVRGRQDAVRSRQDTVKNCRDGTIGSNCRIIYSLGSS